MENVVVIPCGDVEAGRRVLRSLDDLAGAKAVELRAAAVVERRDDGRWHFPEETENVSYVGTITSGALGALLGLLAGPAGLLFGGAAGFLVGSSVEISDADQVETIVHALSGLVPPGSTAVIADLLETSPEPVDLMVERLGTTSWRMTRGEAQRQVEIILEQRAAAESGSGRPSV